MYSCSNGTPVWLNCIHFKHSYSRDLDPPFSFGGKDFQRTHHRHSFIEKEVLTEWELSYNSWRNYFCLPFAINAFAGLSEQHYQHTCSSKIRKKWVKYPSSICSKLSHLLFNVAFSIAMGIFTSLLYVKCNHSCHNWHKHRSFSNLFFNV